MTIPKKNACFHYNSLITNGLIFIQIRHSLIGEFTLFLHLHHHFFAQAVRNLYFRQGLTPFLLGSDTFPSRSDTFSRALLLLAVYSVTFSTSSVTFPSYLVTISQSLITFSTSSDNKKRVSHFVTPLTIHIKPGDSYFPFFNSSSTFSGFSSSSTSLSTMVQGFHEA